MKFMKHSVLALLVVSLVLLGCDGQGASGGVTVSAPGGTSVSATGSVTQANSEVVKYGMTEEKLDKVLDYVFEGGPAPEGMTPKQLALAEKWGDHLLEIKKQQAGGGGGNSRG